MVLVLLLLCLFPSWAGADPLVEMPVPSDPGQGVSSMIAGPSGSMWVAEALNEATDSSKVTMRIARVAEDGRELAAVSVPGTAYGASMVSASDGGVWVMGTRVNSWNGSLPGLYHVTLDGELKPVAWPEYPDPASSFYLSGRLAAGNDGRVWTMGCATKPFFAAPCAAFAVSEDGTLSRYDLPLAAPVTDAQVTSFSSSNKVLATRTGVWFLSRHASDAARNGFTAFVSYTGTVTPVDVPLDVDLRLPASGDSVWTTDSQLAPVNIGQLDPDGRVHDQHALNEPKGDWVHLSLAPNGGVFWNVDDSANADGNHNRDGALGVVGSVGDWRQDVPVWSTSIPMDPAGTTIWSGSCEFGADGSFLAADGGAWVLSAGHPGRFTYRAPDGSMRNFRLPSQTIVQSNGRYSDNGGAWSPVLSSSGVLWFAGASDGKGLLIKANPLSPPPGEKEYPREAPNDTRALGSRTPSRAAILAALGAALKSGAAPLLRGLLGSHHKFIFKANLLDEGSLSLTVRALSRRSVVVVASGRGARQSSGPGPVRVSVRSGRLGTKLLESWRRRSRRAARLSATLVFQDRSGGSLTVARKLN